MTQEVLSPPAFPWLIDSIQTLYYELMVGGRKQRANRGWFWTPKTESFLPKYTTSKSLRYEKQIKAQDLFRLLSLEMLHGGRKT